ncbi:MAG: 4-hydroxy-3-methylbut-2-enyl diphosphate reductase, partial [Chloroflexi bacterium]|nr:4-hydroxy-3-methylbut-2-enyl diphosphate reductase [Chloroflexota bacterium]
SIESIHGKFSDSIIRNDLCYATTNRQSAVKEMADKIDLMLVIGATNSSNCNRLRETAEAHGVRAYLINGVDEIQTEWLDGAEDVGITSGASTPEYLVKQVIESLAPEEIIDVEVAKEDITFVLPRELR